MKQRSRFAAAAAGLTVIFGAAAAAAGFSGWQREVPAAAASQAVCEVYPLDINAADEAEIASLPGIGGTLAQRIVAYRQAHGGFRSVSELDRVDGMGRSRLEAIDGLVTVRG